MNKTDYMKKYNRLNEEKLREYRRAYYQKHRAERLTYAKRYNAEHKEEIAEYTRAYNKLYYKANRERIIERVKENQRRKKAEAKMA